MPPSARKSIDRSRAAKDTAVTPEEKERLQSLDIKKRLEFFDGEVNIHIANRFDRRQKAYRLLYDLYSKMGIIRNKNGGLWLSIHDALPDTITFVAEDDQGGIEGALTEVFDSAIGLPADDLYKKEIDRLRNRGEKVSEIVSLGISTEGKASVKVLASLFYCAFLHAWQKENTTAVVITVHSDYEDFYHRRVGFEILGPVRNYAKVNGEPTVLLYVSLDELDRLRRQKRVFPFYLLPHSIQEELHFTQSFKSMNFPMSDEEFFLFFIEKTDIWKKASPVQRNFIKGVYPVYEVNHGKVAGAGSK